MEEQRESFIEMNVGDGINNNKVTKKAKKYFITTAIGFAIICSIIMATTNRRQQQNNNNIPTPTPTATTTTPATTQGGSDRFYRNQLNLLNQRYRVPLKDLRETSRVLVCSLCKNQITKNSIFGQSSSAHYDQTKRNCPLKNDNVLYMQRIEAESLFYHEIVSKNAIFTKPQLLNMIANYGTNFQKAAFLDGIISVGAKLEGIATDSVFDAIRPLLKKF